MHRGLFPEGWGGSMREGIAVNSQNYGGDPCCIELHNRGIAVEHFAHHPVSGDPADGPKHADYRKFFLRVLNMMKRQRAGQTQSRHIAESMKKEDWNKQARIVSRRQYRHRQQRYAA
jgi:hypothetical protein